MTEGMQIWLRELRSGKYKQGIGRLCLSGSYCCLGVACEAYQQFGPGDLTFMDAEVGRIYEDRYSCTLPPKVAAWLGINSFGKFKEEDPLFSAAIRKHANPSNTPENYQSLVGLNDLILLPFDHIADFIEKGNIAPYEHVPARSSS